MMTLFHIPFPGGSTSRRTLAQRRRSALIRRTLAAATTGLMVFFTLQCLLLRAETQPVVVAKQSVKRGERVGVGDVEVRRIAATPLLDSSLHAADEVKGRIAQVDISPGEPILASMARDAPVVPKGFAVIQARLATAGDTIIAGDTISLVSTVGCEGKASHAAATCTLVESALAMGGSLGSGTGPERFMPLAMPPEQAAKILRVQQQGAVMAVTHAP